MIIGVSVSMCHIEQKPMFVKILPFLEFIGRYDWRLEGVRLINMTTDFMSAVLSQFICSRTTRI